MQTKPTNPFTNQQPSCLIYSLHEGVKLMRISLIRDLDCAGLSTSSRLAREIKIRGSAPDLSRISTIQRVFVSKFKIFSNLLLKNNSQMLRGTLLDSSVRTYSEERAPFMLGEIPSLKSDSTNLSARNICSFPYPRSEISTSNPTIAKGL